MKTERITIMLETPSDMVEIKFPDGKSVQVDLECIYYDNGQHEELKYLLAKRLRLTDLL